MSSTSHPPSLLILSLPKQALVGIDLLSLTASSRFNGFTTLPPGWHFLFVGANETLSSRQGLWFKVTIDGEVETHYHAGKKRQRADSQPLGARGEVIPHVTSTLPTKAWLGVLKWSSEDEELKSIDEISQLEEWWEKLLRLSELQKSLFPYRQSVLPSGGAEEEDQGGNTGPEQAQDFRSLTSHISQEVLERICGPATGQFWTLDTASSTLVDAEAERIPGLELNEKMLGKPLNLLQIDLKQTWPPGAVGRERTDGARDRSWRLREVVRTASKGNDGLSDTQDDPMAENGSNGHHLSSDTQKAISEGGGEGWGSNLLAEFEFCFLMILCLANWSCLLQWRRILELCLTCESEIIAHPDFFCTFLNLLDLQLQHTNVVDGGLFDVESDGGDLLKKLFRRFENTIEDLAALGSNTPQLQPQPPLSHPLHPVGRARRVLDKVMATARDIWGWEVGGGAIVKKGLVQLEDGEVVEMETQEQDEDDETGEYAPVVVVEEEGKEEREGEGENGEKL